MFKIKVVDDREPVLCCHVCGAEIPLTKETVYLAKKAAAPFSALTTPPVIYHAVDCPKCGCQRILSVREPRAAENAQVSLKDMPLGSIKGNADLRAAATIEREDETDE